MASKFILGLCILAGVASALPFDNNLYNHPEEQHYSPGYGGQLIQDVAAKDYYKPKHAPIDYKFEYGVHDEHTGDIKSAAEEQKDGVIRGRYELIDADGYRRIVEYTADDEHGFRAYVHREPLQIQVSTPEPYHFEQIKVTTPEPFRFDIKRAVSPEVTYGSVGATVATPNAQLYTTVTPTKEYGSNYEVLGTAAAYLKSVNSPLSGLSGNYGHK